MIAFQNKSDLFVAGLVIELALVAEKSTLMPTGHRPFAFLQTLVISMPRRILRNHTKLMALGLAQMVAFQPRITNNIAPTLRHEVEVIKLVNVGESLMVAALQNQALAEHVSALEQVYYFAPNVICFILRILERERASQFQALGVSEHVQAQASS